MTIFLSCPKMLYQFLQSYLFTIIYVTVKIIFNLLLQVQFLVIVLQVTVNYKVLSCPPSYILFGVIVFNTLLFTYLFSDFYINSYIKNNRERLTKNEGQLYNRNVYHVANKNGTIIKNNGNLHKNKHKIN